MLRLATGACYALRKEALPLREALHFWWEPFGTRRGLWASGNEPDNCADLWADIEPALRDEAAWAQAAATPDASYSTWKQDRASDLLTMSSCERIALWGLGL